MTRSDMIEELVRQGARERRLEVMRLRAHMYELAWWHHCNWQKAQNGVVLLHGESERGK